MFDYWPPFLFLTELYNHLLLTMGDDEFFAPPHRTPSNPLTLDEVIAYSRQLLEITFPLYWQLELQLGKPVLLDGLQITWEYVRERCTQCLQALHARE
jgi:ubiquitin-protein ligase E3 C